MAQLPDYRIDTYNCNVHVFINVKIM